MKHQVPFRVLLLEYGGVSIKNTMELLTHLDKRDFRCAIAVFNDVPRDIVSYIEAFGVLVFKIRSPEELEHLVVQEEIDIVHMNRDGSGGGEYIQAAKSAGAKIIVETNVFGYPDRGESGKLIDYSVFPSIFTIWAYANRAGLQVNSILDRGRVLYHPISYEKFRRLKPSDGMVSDIRASLGLKDSTCLLLRVARPDPRKWGLLVISALRKLIRKNPDVRLLCVGGLTPQARALVNSLKLESYVINAGRVDDDTLIRLYHVSDIFAHSSFIGETFGVAIAEAMMASKPIVVNSTPWVSNSQLELVDPNSTGLVATGPQDFADKIQSLIRDPELRLTLGRKSLSKARTMFEAGVQAECLGRIYKHLLFHNGFIAEADVVKSNSLLAMSPGREDILEFGKKYRGRLEELGYPTNRVSETFLRGFMHASDNLGILRNVNGLAGGRLPRYLDYVGNFS